MTKSIWFSIGSRGTVKLANRAPISWGSRIRGQPFPGVESVLRLSVFDNTQLAVVLDVFSCSHLPHASFAQGRAQHNWTELVEHAVQRFGLPKHFVSEPSWSVHRVGLPQMGAAPRCFALLRCHRKDWLHAIIEWLWRTLKEATIGTIGKFITGPSISVTLVRLTSTQLPAPAW